MARMPTEIFTNLIPIQPVKTKHNPNIKFGIWNAQSKNKISASICDLIISKHLDILAVTETWMSGCAYDSNTVAEILNTLKDFEFHDIPRQNRAGGGVGILLRKGFTVLRRDCIPFTSMEYMDVVISHGTSIGYVALRKTVQHQLRSLRNFQLSLNY